MQCIREGLLGLAALTFISIAGCEPYAVKLTGPHPMPPQRYVGVASLQQRFGLKPVEETATFVMLSDGRHNLVMIYPDPGGQVFVNAVQVGPTGGVIRDEGEVMVPQEVEDQIAKLLAPHAVVTVPQPPPIAPQPVVPPQPAREPVAGRVVVDPGHGGKDPGAQSTLGFWEKGVVLDVGNKLARDLQARGASVSMTRSDDTFVELDGRAAFANRQRVDLFVSVHADSSPNPEASGFTVYISRHAGSEALAAAQAIEHSLRGAGFASRGIGRADYRVVKNTDMPAVLVELGYLTNGRDARNLNDPSQRTRYAQAICDGAAAWLKANK